jgi:hypothetical protein
MKDYGKEGSKEVNKKKGRKGRKEGERKEKETII